MGCPTRDYTQQKVKLNLEVHQKQEKKKRGRPRKSEQVIKIVKKKKKP